MKYIIIDTFGGYNILHENDEIFITGSVKEATEKLKEIQQGFVVPICNIINIIEELYNTLDAAIFDAVYTEEEIISLEIINTARNIICEE